MVPSNIGLVRGPLKAERRVRFPQEPLAENSLFSEFFFMTQVFEYRFSGGALNPKIANALNKNAKAFL